LSLEKIAYLLPKKFKDHRDFYAFASLVAIGYVDNDHLLDKDNPNPNRYKEQLLARGISDSVIGVKSAVDCCFEM